MVGETCGDTKVFYYSKDGQRKGTTGQHTVVNGLELGSRSIERRGGGYT